MKHYILLALIVVFTIGCGSNGEKYGDDSITETGAIHASKLQDMMEGKDSLVVKIEGVIAQCCQKKGCWMDMDLGNGQKMTVRFKDYGFFIPMNSTGKTAIVQGVAKIDTQSVEWLRHKAEDENKSAEEIALIVEPEVSLTFLADAVIIK